MNHPSNIWFSSGIVGYQLIIGLNAWILGLLWKRGFRNFFTAYIAVCLASNLVEFPLLLAYGLDAYSHAYWIANPLLLAAEIMAAAELLGKPKWGYIPSLAVMGLQSYFVYMLDNRAVEVQRFTLIAVAMACVPIACKQLQALGLFIATGGSAIIMKLAWLANAENTRYLPTYVFLFANALWVVAAFRLRTRHVEL